MNINIAAWGEDERVCLRIEGKDAPPIAYLKVIETLVCAVATALRQAGVPESKVASRILDVTLAGLLDKPDGEYTATIIGTKNPGGGK